MGLNYRAGYATLALTPVLHYNFLQNPKARYSALPWNMLKTTHWQLHIFLNKYNYLFARGRAPTFRQSKMCCHSALLFRRSVGQSAAPDYRDAGSIPAGGRIV